MSCYKKRGFSNCIDLDTFSCTHSFCSHSNAFGRLREREHSEWCGAGIRTGTKNSMNNGLERVFPTYRGWGSSNQGISPCAHSDFGEIANNDSRDDYNLGLQHTGSPVLLPQLPPLLVLLIYPVRGRERTKTTDGDVNHVPATHHKYSSRMFEKSGE